MKGMNSKMVQPIILNVGIIHRNGYDKFGEGNFSYKSKKEGDYSLPFMFDEKEQGFCECVKMGVSSAMLAHLNSKVLENMDRACVGVYCGTAYGGFPESEKKQCIALKQKGPNAILPGMSIHSGYHLTADIIAIKYQIQGPNMTMVSGRLASALAFLNAYDDIKEGTVKYAIVTGTDVVDDTLFKGLCLSESKGCESICSGAGTVILSDANIVGIPDKYPYVKAVEANGDNCIDRCIEYTIYKALETARLSVRDIGMIISIQRDVLEERIIITEAVDKIFGGCLLDPVVFSVDIFGDTLGAGFVMAMSRAFQAFPEKENVLLVVFEENNLVLVTIVGK